MKRLEVFLLPPDGMLVHRSSLPRNFVWFPQQIAGTHLYTWVERGTVRVKCLAQEHNTMSPARARTRTARSRDEPTNHEATAPQNTIHRLNLITPKRSQQQTQANKTYNGRACFHDTVIYAGTHHSIQSSTIYTSRPVRLVQIKPIMFIANGQKLINQSQMFTSIHIADITL